MGLKGQRQPTYIHKKKLFAKRSISDLIKAEVKSPVREELVLDMVLRHRRAFSRCLRQPPPTTTAPHTGVALELRVFLSLLSFFMQAYIILFRFRLSFPLLQT